MNSNQFFTSYTGIYDTRGHCRKLKTTRSRLELQKNFSAKESCAIGTSYLTTRSMPVPSIRSKTATARSKSTINAATAGCRAWQENERTREKMGQGARGPGSEQARERKFQGANWPGFYWPVRSGERIGPGAKSCESHRTGGFGDNHLHKFTFHYVQISFRQEEQLLNCRVNITTQIYYQRVATDRNLI